MDDDWEKFGLSQKVSIPLLVEFPPNLSLLEFRLRGYGYQFASVADLLKDSGGADPQIALVPVTNQTPLRETGLAVQALRLRYPDLTFLGAYAGKLKLPVGEVFQNLEIESIFQFPFEEDLLVNKICEIVPVELSRKNYSLEHLFRLPIAELEGVSRLPFDIYVFLPMSRHAIKYLAAGQILERNTFLKFKDRPSYSLYIKRGDMKRYLEFSQRRVNPQAPVSQVKILAQLSGLLRSFFSEIECSEADGKELLENIRSVLAALIENDLEQQDVVHRISLLIAQSFTTYSHSYNVSAYCSFFGELLGFSASEELRLGGLLHDIGFVDLPKNLMGESYEQLSESDQAHYRQHPELGQRALQLKKMGLSSTVIDMVLMHHEHTDGSGYPFGKRGSEISPYAKICAFADIFDKLTSMRNGFRKLTPMEAIRRIAGLDGRAPEAIYDAHFHAPLIRIFLEHEARSMETAGPVRRPDVSKHVSRLAALRDDGKVPPPAMSQVAPIPLDKGSPTKPIDTVTPSVGGSEPYGKVARLGTEPAKEVADLISVRDLLATPHFLYRPKGPPTEVQLDDIAEAALRDLNLQISEYFKAKLAS